MEQEVPEQEEAKQEVLAEQENLRQTVAVLTLDDDASLTSDPLSERDGWPKWFVDAINYLQEMSTAEAWLNLLTNYVKLERKLGFAGVVGNPIWLLCPKLTNINREGLTLRAGLVKLPHGSRMDVNMYLHQI